MDFSSKQETARRRGRLFGILVFAAIVTAFTAVCSVEIIIQAWATPGMRPVRGAGAPDQRP